MRLSFRRTSRNAFVCDFLRTLLEIRNTLFCFFRLECHPENRRAVILLRASRHSFHRTRACHGIPGQPVAHIQGEVGAGLAPAVPEEDEVDRHVMLFEELPHRRNGNLRRLLRRVAVDAGGYCGKCHTLASMLHSKL